MRYQKIWACFLAEPPCRSTNSRRRIRTPGTSTADDKSSTRSRRGANIDRRAVSLTEGPFEAGDYCFATHGESLATDHYYYLYPADVVEVDVENNITRIQWWDGDNSFTTGPFTHTRKGLLLVDDVIEVEYGTVWCGGKVTSVDIIGLHGKVKEKH